MNEKVKKALRIYLDYKNECLNCERFNECGGFCKYGHAIGISDSHIALAEYIEEKEPSIIKKLEKKREKPDPTVKEKERFGICPNCKTPTRPDGCPYCGIERIYK